MPLAAPQPRGISMSSSGPLLLAAEDVGVARASARHRAVDRELDRQGRVERDVVGDLRSVDAEDPANLCTLTA
jgi:hypothetical protein